jgi:hypothetical protein
MHDTNQYAIRGHRLRPKVEYPRTATVANYQTLGTSNTTLQDWMAGPSTGEIGNLTINGSHGLRNVLAETWSQDATIGEIGATTDFAPDLLQPTEPFSRSPVKRKYAPFDITPARATSRSASPATQPVNRARSTSPAAKSGPSTRARSKTKSKSPNRIKRQASVQTRAQEAGTGAPGVATIASTHVNRQLSLDKPVNVEPSAPTLTAAPKPLQRRAAAITLAEDYNNTSFQYIDNHQTTGNVETLTGTIVGATVFESSFPETPDQGRLIAQLSDGSVRLMTPNQVAQSPTDASHQG